MSAGARTRARAAETVFRVVCQGASLDTAVGERGGAAQDRDHSLYRELSFGTVRWYWFCKGIVDALLSRPLKKKERVIECLMCAGIYQLAHMRLPPHAAIHSSVQACALLERPGLKGLVNGVLRNFQRRRAELSGSLDECARAAYPEWLWRAIMDQWPEQARTVIDVGNTRPPMTLRVNLSRGSVPEYLDLLRQQGIGGVPLDGMPAAITVEAPIDVKSLPGFSEGRVSVQDASAQMLSLLIRPERGERVLDACAAPGGKLTHMLETFPGPEYHAIEYDPERVRRIMENLERLGLDANVTVADAGNLEQWWDERAFDLVVLDAPCSGTGVLRRHPDIKILRRHSDVDRFAETQTRLLEQLWRTVKPDGRLVYITCSILAAENQDRVAAFVGATPDCREERVTLPAGFALSTGWQILPSPAGGDGFYYAVLRKA